MKINKSLDLSIIPSSVICLNVIIRIAFSQGTCRTTTLATVYVDENRYADQYRDDLNFSILPHDNDQGLNLKSLNAALIPAEFVGIALGDPEYPHDSQLIYNSKGELVDSSGLVVSLFYDLAATIKFRPVLEKGEGWGEKLSNGSWTGMPRQLLDPKYDDNDNVIIISSSTLTLDRVSEFTFLQPTYSSHYLAHFRPPVSKSFRNVFLQPFKTEVWQSILVVSIILGFLLRVIYVFENQNMSNDPPSSKHGSVKNAWFDNLKLISDQYTGGIINDGCHDETGSGSFSDVFLWIIANLCQKGGYLQPKNNSLRIIFFCFVLTMTIMFVAYSAILVSIFSLNQDMHISDLKQLHRRHYTIFGDEAIPFIFQVMESGSLSFNSSNRYGMSLRDAVPKVLTSTSAIVTMEGFYNEFRRQNYSSTDYCKHIFTMPLLRQRRQAGMYVRKQWKFKDIFAQTIIKILERGLHFRYLKISNQASRPHCNKLFRPKGTPEQIQLEDAITAFILLFSGFGISLCILVVENAIYYLGYLKQELKLSHMQTFLRP